MSYNGSGTFALPAGNPVTTNTAISSSVHNTTLSEIATGLSTAICKDGQTTITANLPMAGYRHTGVGNPTARTQYATAAGCQDNTYSYLTSVAGTNTITATAALSMAAYATGQAFVLLPANTNTGAATLNLNSIGAKNVYSRGAACVGGELVANVPALVVYDGTQFNLVGEESVVVVVNTTRDISLTSSQAISAGFQPRGVMMLSAVSGASAASSAMSVGWSDGTTQAFLRDNHNVVNDSWIVTPSFFVQLLIDGSNYNTGTVAMTATGCTITWSKTGSPTGSATMTFIFWR